MESGNAIALYEDDKKSLAKYRAEKRLASLRTIEDRLRANKVMYAAMILNSAPMGVALAQCWFMYDYLGFIFTATDLFGACLTASIVFLNFFLILFANNMFLRNRFKRQEMLRLEAEEAEIVRAKKLLLKHPENPELKQAYKNLVDEVRRSRQEDEEPKELLLEDDDSTETARLEWYEDEREV